MKGALGSGAHRGHCAQWMPAQIGVHVWGARVCSSGAE